MESRKHQGKVIKKELLFSGNYKLTIQTKEGKIRFCYTKRFEAEKHTLYLEELREKEAREWVFFDSQKNGGKYYFLDKIELANKEAEISPETAEALDKRKSEIEEFQINQLIKQYKIKDLEQLELRVNQLKHDIKGVEYWALLIIKYKKLMKENRTLNEKENKEKELLDFISFNWKMYG